MEDYSRDSRSVHFSISDDGYNSSTETLSATRKDSQKKGVPPPAAVNSDLSTTNDDDDGAGAQLLFSHDDDGDEGEGLRGDKHSQHDEAACYPPKPLKSTIPSREAQFELDSNELEEGEEDDSLLLRDGAGEPLLMEGLLQSGARRGSVDVRRDGRTLGREDGIPYDQPPDWLTKGAGILAGIANMSNSILGAGIIGELLPLLRRGGGADFEFCRSLGLPYALREAGLFTGLVLRTLLIFLSSALAL